MLYEFVTYILYRIAAFVEWKSLYILGKDKDGLLQKESIRGVFDGSLFVKLEEKNNLSKKKHMYDA